MPQDEYTVQTKPVNVPPGWAHIVVVVVDREDLGAIV